MASVLETFLILFESNAEDTDKGAKQAKKSADDLETSLNQTDKAAEKTAQSFVKLLSTAGGAIASVLSVAAITSAVMSAAGTADELNDFTDKLGLNIEEVNAWGDAVQVNGGTAEGFRASVENLIDGLVTFAAKGSSRVAPFFQELGIKMVDAKGKARDVTQILPELAEKFEKLSKQQSAGLGRRLGLDQGTIMLLQQGRREVEAQIARQKELGTVTKADAEIAGKFNDTYDDTHKVFRSLFTMVGSTVLPIFTSILEGMQSVGIFLQKHSDFIVGLLIALGAAVAVYVLPPLVSMAVAAIAAFAPFLIMGAIIAGVAVAFALLYDDVMNFLDGNDSLIGQILTNYPIIGDLINGLINYVRMLWDAVSWVFNSILSVLQISVEGWRLLFGAIGDGIQSFIDGSGVMQSIIGAVTATFEAAGEAIGAVWDYLGERVQGFINLVRTVINLVAGIAGKITGALDGVKASLGIGGLSEGQTALATAGASPINTQNSNTIANSSRSSSKTTNVQTGPITVQTQATDAEGIAGAIGNSMGQQIRQATSTFDDGIEA